MMIYDRREAREAGVGRRVFIQRAAGAALLSGLAPWTPASAGAVAAGPQPRRRLAEPGPMVPPVPAILLTVSGKPGVRDEISVVWTFVLNGEPPQVGISVGKEHVAGELVARHGEFVLNVPTAPIIKAFDTVDMHSSRFGDKFALSGLTGGKAVVVAAPTVDESPIQVECRVLQRIELPPVRTVYFAEVVATTVHEGACDAEGRLNAAAVPFFGMTAGSGEFYTMGRAVGHIGMTVGRNDIKY